VQNVPIQSPDRSLIEWTITLGDILSLLLIPLIIWVGTVVLSRYRLHTAFQLRARIWSPNDPDDISGSTKAIEVPVGETKVWLVVVPRFAMDLEWLRVNLTETARSPSIRPVALDQKIFINDCHPMTMDRFNIEGNRWREKNGFMWRGMRVPWLEGQPLWIEIIIKAAVAWSGYLTFTSHFRATTVTVSIPITVRK